MDFRRYVTKKVSTGEPKKHYIGPIENPEDWAVVTEVFGTSSPKELGQILIGLAKDLKAGKAQISFTD